MHPSAEVSLTALRRQYVSLTAFRRRYVCLHQPLHFLKLLTGKILMSIVPQATLHNLQAQFNFLRVMQPLSLPHFNFSHVQMLVMEMRSRNDVQPQECSCTSMGVLFHGVHAHRSLFLSQLRRENMSPHPQQGNKQFLSHHLSENQDFKFKVLLFSVTTINPASKLLKCLQIILASNMLTSNGIVFKRKFLLGCLELFGLLENSWLLISLPNSGSQETCDAE